MSPAPSVPSREEIVVAPPTTMATSFRSTWLTTSFRAMKQRGLTDKYLRLLPQQYHEQVMLSEAGVWLPVEVATAHYEDEVVKIGMEVTQRFHGTMMSTMFRLAQSVGVTPWAILTQVPRIYAKSWVGGGVGVYRSGPRDARIVMTGWPMAKFAYTRNGTRGILLAGVGLFCKEAQAQTLQRFCSDTEVCVRLQWV
jgi:hypothetical protein